MHRKFLYLSIVMVGVILLAACATPTPVVQTVEVTKQVEVTRAVEVTRIVEAAPAAQPTAAPAAPALKAPYQDQWAGSGHADAKAMAFNDWNDAGAVPLGCAKCHSPAGYVEFISTGKVVTNVAISPGHVITCDACHNDAAVALSQVAFPSGAVITGLGPEARCLVCHQGRQSTVSVNKYITSTFKITDYDAVVAPMVNNGVTTTFSFQNVHYFAAGATQYGTEVKGGYEYAGKEYDAKFDHVLGVDTCLACHDQHGLKLKVEVCGECHGIKTAEEAKNIREPSMSADYNGNGDTKEGIALEVKGLQDTLYQVIQAYANDVAKTPIVYDAATNPYFFVAGADGKAKTDAKGAAIRYNAWTARLLQAAYNYQFTIKDPGSYAHNPRYTIELLYDSIADLNPKLAKPIDMSKMTRQGSGHFAGNTMPFRDWDSTGVVPAGCARCHSAEGLPTYISNAGTLVVDGKGNVQVTGIIGMPTADGFQCSTCHDTAKMPALIPVTGVVFPSGKSVTFSTEQDDKGALKPVAANLCLECHQGRQSTAALNKYLASLKDADKLDAPNAAISFKNVHYFAAGATLFGTEAQVAYEYSDQTYVGRNEHGKLGPTTCTGCHDKHALTILTDSCKACHGDVKDPGTIRFAADTTDWNGNGDVKEPIEKEIATFQERLYAAIQKYAADKAGAAIVYDGAENPYFFLDANKDGKPDTDDKGALVRYNAWTPRLLKAAYNYQFSIKDPGAFSHNPKYVMQFLYDSLKDIGGDVAGLTRPETPKK